MVSFTIYVCVRIKQALTRKEATYMLVDNKMNCDGSLPKVPFNRHLIVQDCGKKNIELTIRKKQ